jgi:hypothetical protein
MSPTVCGHLHVSRLIVLRCGLPFLAGFLFFRFFFWKPGESQDILKKAFAPFGLAEGQIFKEFDLIYLHDGLLFWGARNVDGRGFDTEENRPTNLQIPLHRK